MSEFKKYRKSQVAEIREYVPGEELSPRTTISDKDKEAGSPKQGDMIARNPEKHEDQWLISAEFFAQNYVPAE